MPVIFPISQKYLSDFHKSRKDTYKAASNDFHPTRHNNYGYPQVKEPHRRPIYDSVKDLDIFFGNENDILDLQVPENFATPNIALKALTDYKNYLEKDRESLQNYLPEYSKGTEPFPLVDAINLVSEVIEVMNHILTFDEIKKYLNQANDLFNFYIRIGDKKQIIHAIDKTEIQEIFSAIKDGNPQIVITGRKIHLEEYDTIQIYDVSKSFNKFNKSSLKNEIHIYEKTLHLKGIDMLKHCGIDVTSEFEIPIPRNFNKKIKTEIPKDKQEKEGKIFISHSTKDKPLVEKFIDHILILGFGVKREEIFCTSVDGTNIQSGVDFKKVIYKELKDSKAVIQIITKNYKSSEICLNEMGAAWVTADVIIPLVANPFSYDIGFINSSTQQLKLNDEVDLLKLHDDYKEILFKNDVSKTNLFNQIKFFREFVKNYTLESEVELENDNVFFYEEESTIKGILKSGVFGHPIMEKFEESASFHRYYVLELDSPIDVLTQNISEVSAIDRPVFKINRVQIFLEEKDEELEIRKLVNKRVSVTGKFMAGYTQWHQTEVLIRNTKIKQT